MALPSSGPLALTDIQTEFGGSNPISISEYYAGGAYVAAGTSGTYGAVPSSGQISIRNFYGTTAAILAPVGLIVPYTGASAPTNWSMFTAANGRLIVGAGGSYASTTTGGSSSLSISGSTNTNGSHTGSTDYAFMPSVSGMDQTAGTDTSGSHSHSFSGSASAQDVYKTFTLIKCTTASKIPANGMLLAATTLSALTNVETSTDRFIQAAASYGTTGGSASISGSVTSSSSGSHAHGYRNGAGYCETDNGYGNADAGSHTHTVSISGSLNTKRIYLSAWSDAVADYGIALNGIAMYEGTTAPTGWVLCNGTAGTPDLRNYFVRIGTTSNHGTTSGDNTASWTASASGSASHSHFGGSHPAFCRGGNKYHGGYSWSHSHSASGTVTVTQPYYALSFIKYVG